MGAWKRPDAGAHIYVQNKPDLRPPSTNNATQRNATHHHHPKRRRRQNADTGGLVTDSWHEFEWKKLRFLQQRFGLRPWYMQ